MRSLRLRLLIGAACAIAAALVVGWITLVLLFDRHLRRNVEDDLIRHGRELVSQLTFGPEAFSAELYQPADRRFSLPASGIYWQASRGAQVVRSRSLWDNALETPANVTGAAWQRSAVSGPFGQRVVKVARAVQANAAASPVIVQVAASEREIVDARDEFGRELAVFLVLLWAALSAAAWLQVRIGLKPLRDVQSSVHDLQSSPASRLDPEDFATEVAPLVDQINQLADAREADLRAAQDRAANLAHALKTPLSAQRALARNVRALGADDLAEGLESSVQAASETVDRELARARTAASRDRGPTSARPVLDRLVAVLRRTEQGSALSFEFAGPAEVRLPVSAEQLMEMAGPLLENAARHARSRVLMRVEAAMLAIEDDGPGLSEAERETVLARGQRADERPGGYGLGLAIANDLAEATGASLALDVSPLGGLCVRVRW